MLTPKDHAYLTSLIIQQERERVVPKLDCFRLPMRIKLAKSGRGTGKSWAIASLLIQLAHRRKVRIGCFREIQKTLEESSYALMKQTVERLGYQGWKITNESLESPCGSKIIFRGLKDIRAANQVKGLESFDIFWLEEAAVISNESLSMIMPTLRKPGSELWASWNPETESDPIDLRLWQSNRDDVFRIWLEPGPIDNPWWGPELQKEMEADYALDPDEAEHIWGGQPRKQGQRSVMSRVAIRAAMERKIEPVGIVQIGCDVARYGDDRTVIYKRKGLAIVDHKSFSKQDTMTTAYECWAMANHDPSIPIYVDDSGVGGGVTDRLRELGAKVYPVNFGGSPADKDKYTSIADELWFNFPVDEASIPDDPVLMAELSGRQYAYDHQGRRKIESKDDYKKRCGRSPDEADALLLCYYDGTGIIFPDEIREQMARRRRW
jgi:phage terminase large subunit